MLLLFAEGSFGCHYCFSPLAKSFFLLEGTVSQVPAIKDSYQATHNKCQHFADQGLIIRLMQHGIVASCETVTVTVLHEATIHTECDLDSPPYNRYIEK